MTDRESPNLTPRETEILRLMCAGLGTTQIAVRLGISDRTVESHRANVMGKAGCRNAFQLGVWAAHAGLADVSTNITRAASEAHSSDRVSPITGAAALPSAQGTPRGA